MRVIGVTMTIARRITGTRKRKKKVRKFEGKMKKQDDQRNSPQDLE